MEPIDQARRYFFSGKGVPPAISGQNGHAQALWAATSLINGFALNRSESEIVLREWNQTCQPPWSETELQHKLNEAERTSHPKPRGHLLHKNSASCNTDVYLRRPVSGTSSSGEQIENKPLQVRAKQYELVKSPLPEPIEDGTRKFIKALFKSGDGIRITPAELNEDGREVPNGSGAIIEYSALLKMLDAKKGDPNKIWKSSDKTGLYVQLNPAKLEGSGHDRNVTDLRYVLIEFDKIPLDEQFALIVASRIPCAAITYSGGKSIHAVAIVNARTEKEYDERVEIYWEHFDFYQLDKKNRNQARLSRLPGCERFSKRQELLALQTGCKSFEEWLNNEIEPDVEGIGESLDIEKLLEFVPGEDPNCILGNRWICKGGACLFIGQSGVGKSSLSIQMAILWALGKSCFGILPKKPLKSLMIQAENDFGDVAEMFQGVIAGMELTGPEIAQVKKMIVLYRCSRHVGFNFTQAAKKLIQKFKPDLCWIDPLMSYIGDDISKQSVCSQFFREWINPISDETGVAWMMMHHTNKPVADTKARKGWTMTDFAYMGAGSAELVNWARAVCILNRKNDAEFKLMFAKRGLRAGALDFNKDRSVTITLAHSQQGICWNQIADDSPNEEKEKGRSGRKVKEFDYDGFLKHIGKEYFRSTQLVERAAKFSGMSERTIHSKVLEDLKSKLSFDPEYETYSVT